MKAPTSLLILPPELLINPLPPSFFLIPPLHFFTLTLLYPFTSLPFHFFTLSLLYPLTPFTPLPSINSFKRLISSNPIRVVRLVYAARLLCVPPNASVRLVSSCSSLLIYYPLSNSIHSIHSKYSKRSTHITT